MNCKRIFKIWLTIVGVVILSVISIVVVIDPLSLIRFPIISGLNNNKYSQPAYMDVYKPYEYAKKKADVIFIGTSRVYRGIRPSLFGFNEKDIYNWGLSSLSLDHMQEYLRFTYKIHKPKIIFIGIDVFNFSKTNFRNRRDGFSQERLNNVNGFFNLNHAIIESLKIKKHVYKDTFIKSYNDKYAGSLFFNGWYIRDNNAPKIVASGYYSNINSYIKTYNNFAYDEGALLCLENIVKEAHDTGAKVYVFLNPISADIRNIIYLSGHGPVMENMKKQIVERIGRVYDFNFTNVYTTNRSLYYDCSHFSPRMGEYLKEDIIGNKNTERMHILTPYNVNEFIIEDRKKYNEWVFDNIDYVEAMTRKIQKKEIIKSGEFAKYLGF